MSRRLPLLLNLTVILVILTLLTAFWAAGSSWALWSMLPENDAVRLVAGARLPQRSDAFTHISDSPLPDEVKAAVSASRSAAISRTATGTVITLTPRLKDQPRIRRWLREAGWNTERRGLALLAWPDSAVPAPRKGMYTIGKDIVINIWHTFTPEPVAVFYARDRLAVLATARNKAYRLHISNTFDTIKEERVPASTPDSASDLYVAIPGHVLASIPSEIRDKWNTVLISSLQLTHHRPDLLSYLSQYETVAIIQQEDDVAIAVSGAADAFTAAAAVWLESENAYSRPQKQAFRLPDGSLGYEWLPGDREETLQAWQDGCRAPIEGKTATWLCAKTGQAVLSTSESLARSEPHLNGTWRIQASAGWIERNLPPNTCQNASNALERVLCRVEGVGMTGSGHGAVVEISVK